ncbi:pirin family protein [uncultured Amaricoccus sp.]|uniref:pirin family protein n=1 Tax=uncultured Amaricoccus sp. TaxID=339341 RepID=UPI002621F1C5|nr:pirin family protein [uncultured Amaricoccus sp.]
MSWNPTLDPTCPDAVTADQIETLIIPRARDLGGFEVKRALPAPRRQMVGPFIFFDQLGPVEFLTGAGVDVRPHPHIGLSTVTYLFEGGFRHRDSTGADQFISPGDVNWMTAGIGVTHSERTTAETKAHPHKAFGIQTWVALPESAEDSPARFEHAAKANLPMLEAEGVKLRLILGTAFGQRAPVTTSSEMFYADVELAPGAQVPLPDDQEDRGVYVAQGSIEVAGQRFEGNQMMVFRPGDRLAVRAGPAGARLLLLGGATLEGPRHIWWNFVASSRERIEAAKEAWRAGDFHHGRFHLPPGDDGEFIPLPP